MGPEEKKEKPLERPQFTTLCSDLERDAGTREQLLYIDNPLPRSKRILQAEESVRPLQKQKIEIQKDLFEYQLDVLIRICTEIAQGRTWWIPHFMEHMGFGIFDIEAAKERKYDVPRNVMRKYIIKYAKRELSSGFRCSGLVEYMVKWLKEFIGAAGIFRAVTENPFFTQNHSSDDIYIRRTGFCTLGGHIPHGNCQDMMKSKHDLPADGLFYSFYQMMGILAREESDLVSATYWREKFEISRGSSICFDARDFQSRPDLIEDLKQTRRWTLFDLYELEMGRRAATRLLLCARLRDPGCPFYKDAFPLDLLKILFVLADLLPTDEEREKLRGRAYYYPTEK